MHATPALITDPRIRAAYSEGAGIYRIVPAGVAVPRGVEELQRSVRCGSVRRWVESIEIIDAEARARRIVRGAGSGERFVLTPDQRRLVEARFPKTRKNSAGYALDHFADSGDELDLLIGSEGTLAFITAVEWRLEPIPADVAGAALGVGGLHPLARAGPVPVALDPPAGPPPGPGPL